MPPPSATPLRETLKEASEASEAASKQTAAALEAAKARHAQQESYDASCRVMAAERDGMRAELATMREEMQRAHEAQDLEANAQHMAALQAQAEAQDVRAELTALRRQSDVVLCTSAMQSEASAQARACRFECEAVELAKALAVELAVELATDAVAAQDAADGVVAAAQSAADGGSSLGVPAVPRRISRHVGWADAETLATAEAHETEEEDAAEEVGEEQGEAHVGSRAEAHTEAAIADFEAADEGELHDRASTPASSPQEPLSPSCHSPIVLSSLPPDRVGALVDALDELRRLSAALPVVADAPPGPAVGSQRMAVCSTMQSSEPQPKLLEPQPPQPPQPHRTPHATRYATPGTAALHVTPSSPYDASCLPPSPWDLPPPPRELRGHSNAAVEQEPVVEGFGPRWISLMGDSVALGMDLQRMAQRMVRAQESV